MRLKSMKSIAKSSAKRQAKKATGIKSPRQMAADAAYDATGLQKPKKAARRKVQKKTGVKLPTGIVER